jgi:hypothetical protein
MAALKAPPIIAQPEPKLPVPPGLPTELAKTQRAPSTTAATVRATPPTGTPATPEPDAATEQPDDPATQRLQDGQTAALLAENAKLRDDLAKAKALAHGVAEAKVQSFPPPVTPPPPAAVVVQRGVSSETLEAYRKAQTKLMLGVAGFLLLVGAPCALWLTNAATKNESAIKRTQVQATESVKTSESAKVETTSNDKELADVKAELAAFKLYMIVLQQRQGVAIRLPEGVKQEDLPKLDFETPLRKPGQIRPGPGLIVQTPP